MKKVLVTGGAGFIGSHIIDSLINKGYDVSTIDNLSQGKKENINKQATIHIKDITEDINEVFEQEKPDIVIHCAAQVMLRESLKNPIHDAKTNIIGTINVLEACRKNGVKKIIYTSTGGARVGEPRYLPVDEDHPINPTSPYGISKHTAEHYVEMYSNLHDIDHLTFCFGNVYGPRDDPSSKRVISIFIDSMLKDTRPQIFGDGKQTRDFIYVKDLAEFIVDSIEKDPKSRLFHLANSRQISVNEIYKIIKENLGYKEEPIYKKGIKGEVKDIVLDTTKAKNELGWEPRNTYEEGIKKTIDWFKNKDNITDNSTTLPPV